jgi:hypothetical protein
VGKRDGAAYRIAILKDKTMNTSLEATRRSIAQIEATRRQWQEECPHEKDETTSVHLINALGQPKFLCLDCFKGWGDVEAVPVEVRPAEEECTVPTAYTQELELDPMDKAILLKTMEPGREYTSEEIDKFLGA